MLVIDDEDLLRSSTEALLDGCGCQVFWLIPNASRVMRQHHHEIDFILLDMQMPEMDGSTTFAALRKVKRCHLYLFGIQSRNCRRVVGWGSWLFAKPLRLKTLRGFINKAQNVL